MNAIPKRREPLGSHFKQRRRERTSAVSKQILTHERLTSLFEYRPASGLLVRKVTTGSRSPAGQIVGSPVGSGYLGVSIGRSKYILHRLIWMYVYGAWPDHDIDHINGDKHDNRIVNLRRVTKSENQHNLGLKKTNTSGFTGVRKSSSRKNPWAARITINGKEKYLGCFADKSQAAAAHAAAKRIYHPTAPV